MRFAVDKMVPRHVVAGIEPVKIAVHALQFLGAVVGQRFVGLVLIPLRLLLRQALRQIMRRCLRQCTHQNLFAKVLRAFAEYGVQQTARHRICGRQWQALLYQGVTGGLADAPGQGIGPVLGAVEIAHVLVVRVQHHAWVRPYQVGGQRQKAASGASVAVQGRHGDAVGEGDDFQRRVVHGVDVAHGCIGSAVTGHALGGFDVMQVNAVGKELLPPGQHQHLRGTSAYPTQGVAQPMALAFGHGAVVEFKVQPAHAGANGSEFAVVQFIPLAVLTHQGHGQFG